MSKEFTIIEAGELYNEIMKDYVGKEFDFREVFHKLYMAGYNDARKERDSVEK